MTQLSPFRWMRVGHWTDTEARTGCTVVRFDGDVVASGEVRGGAPATREFSLLDPTRLVQSIDAVCLSGGSAFGLAAGDGVARSLRMQGFGFGTAHGKVPIVVGMSLYDLGAGNAMRWPGAVEGSAALDAVDTTFDIGPVGAGTGATIGKWRGADHAKAGGIGFAVTMKDELIVAALVAVNAVGDLVTEPQGDATSDAIRDGVFDWPETSSALGENTTIGVVVTNGSFDKVGCLSLAEAGHDGLARAIIPAHGPSDGDALVAVAKGSVAADLATARLLSSVAVASAVASIRS